MVGIFNKYFYFSLGGLIVFTLVYLFSIFWVKCCKEKENVDEADVIYKIRIILSITLLFYLVLGVVGYLFGGADTPKVDFSNVIFKESDGKVQGILKTSKTSKTSSKTKLSYKDPISSSAEIAGGKISKKDTPNKISLIYITPDNDSPDSYYKKIKSINNVIHIIAYNVSYMNYSYSKKNNLFEFLNKNDSDLYDKKNNIFRFPLVLDRDVKDKLDSDVIIRGRFYKSMRKAINKHIDFIYDLAVKLGIRQITFPYFKDDKGLRVILRENYGDKSNIEVLKYFGERIKEKFNVYKAI